MKTEITPKVSVIIPNYNHAPFLVERIETVLNQTYTDFEVILLDDCSTDGSRTLLLQYQSHPKVSHVVINDKNSGCVFRQWAKGISLAKGEYVWIAESDDKADISFLEAVVKPMEDYPTASVCYVGSYLIDRNGCLLNYEYDSYWKERGLEEGSVRVFPGLKYLKHTSSWNCTVYNASAAIFRRKYFDLINRDYMTFRYCGDWYFWTELGRFGEFIEVIKKLNYFRQSDLGTFCKSRAHGDNYKEDMRVIQHTLELVPMGWYRKNILLGHLLRRIRRDKLLSEDIKIEIRSAFRSHFGSYIVPFLVERINKILVPYFPKLILPQRDRL